MAAKNPYALKPYLFVLIHGNAGSPYAVRLNVHKLAWFLLGVGACFLGTVSGTLLFFRELEVNRRLQDRMLEIETKEKLVEFSQVLVTPLAPRASPTAKEAPKQAIPLIAAASLTKTAPREKVAEKIAETTIVAAADGTATAAVARLLKPTPALREPLAIESVGSPPRIADFNADCVGENCEVKLSLMPTATGGAQGQLLLILEAEIPRIGAGNPTTQVRKRYFIYPGNISRDELPEEAINALESKPFKFTRALHTNASFAIGKLLRPLAVNVYLYDKERTLIHHDRKVIETEE